MIRHPYLPYALAFVSGAGSAGVGIWLLLGETTRTPPPVRTQKPEAAIVSTASPAGEFAAVEEPSNPELTAAERAQRLVTETLRELRHCDDACERAAHVWLLIARLDRAGAAGVEAMSALLASGEDYRLGDVVSAGRNSVPMAGTLRKAVIDALYRSKEPAAWPVCREAVAEILNATGSEKEANYAVRMLEKREPGSHRAEAVAAFIRSLQQPGDLAEREPYFLALHGMWHYGAAELVPYVEPEVLREPEKQLAKYLAALWSVPAATREEATQHVLSDEAARAALISTQSLHRLDYRIAGANECAVDYIQSSQPLTAKVQFLQNLGKQPSGSAEPGNLLIYPPNMPPVAPGAPGTPEQAQARLTLLNQIAPFCREPLLQQKLAETRAALYQQLTPHASKP